MSSRLQWIIVWLVLRTCLELHASAVVFKSVEATWLQGDRQDLLKTIDGISASGRGWSVAPRIDEPQAVIFAASAPLKADLVMLTLCFKSGRPYGSMAEFALSFTCDEVPSMNGKWQALPIVNQSATIGAITITANQHLRADEVVAVTTGRIPDNDYRITARTSGHTVTGLRIDVFPVRRTLKQLLPEVTDVPVMAWAMGGDFVLTEFRAEVINYSTNVALGAPVRASHALYQTMTPVQVMTPEALTDGLPSTFAHPRQPDVGSAFFFEIDLGRVHAIDHILLWGRNDVLGFEKRLSRLHVRLYEDPPSSGTIPVWQGMDRADGSHPQRGEVDLLRATDGKGRFRARYLRLSTDSPEPLSPQIAEVEVYAARPMTLDSLRANGREVPLGKYAMIPPDTQRLSLEMGFTNVDLPPESVFRWRLCGAGDDWIVTRNRILEMRCPPVGSYTFEAQASHSDGNWDSAVLVQALTVRRPFTETAAFYWLLAGVTLSAGMLIHWLVSRRKIATLVAQSALATERTRIARDMHDEVGARLSQLSFLLKAFERNPNLPESAREDLLKLSDTAGQALGSLDEVVWTVNPKNDTLESLAGFLGQHAARYLAPVGIACRLVAPPTWPMIAIPSQIRHDLVMAVKEALQNVVKHSAASEVVMSLALDAGEFVIRVTDNGCGLKAKPNTATRSGLANMKSRLEGLGGTCDIDLRPEGGTTVTLRAPLENP